MTPLPVIVGLGGIPSNTPAIERLAGLDAAEAAEDIAGAEATADQLKDELATAKDAALRAHAEAQNARRRAEQDVEKARKFALERFSGAVGPLFQIVDDIIDLTEGKGRGARGADIREGKCSLLVVIALERARPGQRRALRAVLDKPRPETGPEDVARVMSLFDELQVVPEAWREAERLLAHAKDALRGLPPPLGERLTLVTEALFRRQR